jgi:chaperonin GroES
MLKAVAGKVVLKKINQEFSSPGGVLLPVDAKEKYYQAEVISIGQGLLDRQSQRQPVDLKVGDTVVIQKVMGTPTKHEGVDYLIINQSEVLAVIEEVKNEK